MSPVVGIARTDSLTENLFCVVMCIDIHNTNTKAIKKNNQLQNNKKQYIKNNNNNKNKTQKKSNWC
jgi:hypothetical protein